MRKLRLPQPFAQMVVCGALKSIPNIFDDIKKLEKVFIYADDFEEEFKHGLVFSDKLHQRIWNEITLGNIPDETFYSNCFIGDVIVSSEEKVEDKWNPNCEKKFESNWC